MNTKLENWKQLLLHNGTVKLLTTCQVVHPRSEVDRVCVEKEENEDYERRRDHKL